MLIEEGRRHAIIEATMAHEITNRVIEEAVGNWTQERDELNSTMLQALQSHARTAAIKILDSDLENPGSLGPQWKQALANKACELLQLKEFVHEQTPVVVEALREEFGDTSGEFDGLWGYSLAKIADNVACVAYMAAFGLDPSLLLMTDEEANESLIALARRLREIDPDRVAVVYPGADPQEVVDAIKKRLKPQE